MVPAATIMKRMRPTASSLLRRSCQRSLSSASISVSSGRSFDGSSSDGPLTSPSGSPWRFIHPTQRYSYDGIQRFSSVAQDLDGDDGGHQSNNSNPGPLLPTRHSRNLPPPVCPPSQLQSEIESIFEAPVGSLIVYNKDSQSGSGLKTVEEEMTDAYYASDEIVQRVEYVLRGLNAQISPGESVVSRGLSWGVMALDDDGDDAGKEALTKEECFKVMLDLMDRMVTEGQTYDELRTRVRSQLLDPSSVAEDSGSSSSDSSGSDGDEEREMTEKDADEQFHKWQESMEENMSKAGFSNQNAVGMGQNDESGEDAPVDNKEEYQFGAFPGITAHMYDLVLDSLACLCHEHYHSADRASGFADMVDLMPEKASPPDLAKEILDVVLNRHWMDGGDIGLGNGGVDNPMNTLGQGIGTGAGTGAGSLATINLSSSNTFDARTCPTPMTFNAVLRVAANFDPDAYAEAVENAKVLGGDMGNVANDASTNSDEQLRQERERLRDVTLDAALSTYSRMLDCKALTLRVLKNSTKKATSRSALKRQARLLEGNYKDKRKTDIITGRNSATYAYIIRTIGNCIPPSLSRGNMAFGLYRKGCVEEGVMDERLVEAMRGVGGYVDAVVDDIEQDGSAVTDPLTPPISNGPLFDSFMQEELGSGVKAALDAGRKLRHDRNYKLRRHAEWDGTY